MFRLETGAPRELVKGVAGGTLLLLLSVQLFYSRCLNVQLTMRPHAAETLALRALAWAAADGAALAEFLTRSGLELDDLRARAADPELLAAFLDFVLSGDKVLRTVCAAEDLDPGDLHEARRALPGRAPD